MGIHYKIWILDCCYTAVTLHNSRTAFPRNARLLFCVYRSVYSIYCAMYIIVLLIYFPFVFIVLCISSIYLFSFVFIVLHKLLRIYCPALISLVYLFIFLNVFALYVVLRTVVLYCCALHRRSSWRNDISLQCIQAIWRNVNKSPLDVLAKTHEHAGPKEKKKNLHFTYHKRIPYIKTIQYMHISYMQWRSVEILLFSHLGRPRGWEPMLYKTIHQNSSSYVLVPLNDVPRHAMYTLEHV